MPTEPNQPASRRFGPYMLEKPISLTEGYAVFSALHTNSGQNVSLRLLTITAKDVDDAVRRCQAVLQELAALEIPNGLKIKEFGFEGTTLYIVLDHMPGGSLHDRLLRRFYANPDLPPQRPAVSEVLSLAKRAAEALDAMHSQDLVHGQLGPRSIMFDGDGLAYIGEIGFTRLMKIIYHLGVTNSLNMTRYSPPELWDGERPVPATDQYALACIIYELLTGKAPFDGTSIYALMQAHANDVAVPPNYIQPELPSSLGVIFWQALAKPADRRYESVGAFVDDLLEALSYIPPDRTDFFTFLCN